MHPFKLTFVTAFIDLEESQTHKNGQRDPARALALFEKLLATGVNIHAFVSAAYIPRLPRAENLHVEPVHSWDDVPFSKLCTLRDTWDHQPYSPTPHHDTPRFMALNLSKTEFVDRAAETNAFGASHFAWIDFAIVHVFHQTEETLRFVKMLGSSKLVDSCLVMPGCTPKTGLNFTDYVCWRFCGGFFLGDRASLCDFAGKVRASIEQFVQVHGKLVWEVNFWAWLESCNAFHPEWYKADHNDTIVTAIPRHVFRVEASLTTIPSRVALLYKTLESICKQVSQVHLRVSTSYSRFDNAKIELDPQILAFFPNVILHWDDDLGPATKVIGCGDHAGVWTLIVDDDQVYHPDLVSRMMQSVKECGVYQNRYESVQHGDGGIIHGYVGYLVHSTLLQGIRDFPIPPAARYVDDQWMSIYCAHKGIPIFPTQLHDYQDLFQEMQEGHELIGANALASTGPNRRQCVQEVADFFGVTFQQGGLVVRNNEARVQWHCEE